MSAKPALVVLAAGIGSRYGGLKQIDPVGPGGETLLDYSVFDARRAGFGKVVFLIRKSIEADFRQAIGQRFEQRIDVAYAFQELEMLPAGYSVPADRKKPWGTGHAVLCAARTLNEPFAVINADDFYGADAYRVLAGFLGQPAGTTGRDAYAMVGYQLRRTLSEHGTVARGVCETDAEGNLISVEELTAIEKTADGARNKEADGSIRPLTGNETVSLNCWGFVPSVCPHLERLFAEFLKKNLVNPKAEFYLPAAVTDTIREGVAQVKVLPTTSSWFGVTYREDRPVVIESVRKLVAASEYPERLWV